MKIGVLSLQGDFAQHARMLERLGVPAVEVRTAAALDETAGLIIPGGESTTMVKFIREEGLEPALRAFAADRPVYGTCAGAILLARVVVGSDQFSLGLIDIGVRRNAYGRQVDSFIETNPSALPGPPLEMVFIRAPVIERVGPDVEVLARSQDRPVLVRAGRILAGTFHPELTEDPRVHEYFVAMAAPEG